MATEQAERRLTTTETAIRLRLSESSIYKLVRTGRLTAIRVSPRGKMLFASEEVESLLSGAGQGAAAATAGQ